MARTGLGKAIAPAWLRVEVGALVAIAAVQVGLLAGAAAERFGAGVLFVLPFVGITAVVCFDRIALAPCLVALSTPVGLQALPGGYEVTQVVSAAVVGLVIMRRTAAGQAPLLLPGVLWVGVAFVVLALLSTPGSPDVDGALRQNVSLVLNLLLVCAVASACASVADVRRVAMVLAAVGAVVCVIGLQGLSELEAVNQGQTVNNRARGTFTEPNQFGVFSGIVALVSLGLFLGAETARQRWAAAVSGLVALLALAFTLSRGSWIGAVVGLSVVLLLLPEARARLLQVGVPLVLVGTALVVLQPDRPELQVVRDRVSTFGDVSGNPYDERPAIWAEGRRQVAEKPLLGQGPRQFPTVARRGAETATVSPAHAHNVLLNVAAEIGLLAAALLVAFTLLVLGVARRTVRLLGDLRDRALAAGLAGALGVVVGQGIVDFTLRNAVVIAVLSTVLGLLLSLAAQARQHAGVPVGRVHARALGA